VVGNFRWRGTSLQVGCTLGFSDNSIYWMAPSTSLPSGTAGLPLHSPQQLHNTRRNVATDFHHDRCQWTSRPTGRACSPRHPFATPFANGSRDMQASHSRTPGSTVALSVPWSPWPSQRLATRITFYGASSRMDTHGRCLPEAR
jgi:hypothetical protein